jgi:hypothetical protein
MSEVNIRSESIWYWSKSIVKMAFTGGKQTTLSNLLIRAISFTLLLLLVGGLSVSKLKVVGPLYFVDLAFLTITLLIILLSNFRVVWHVYLISFLTVFVVFLSSFYRSEAPPEIITRQFALFVYPFCSYIISGYLLSLSREKTLTEMIIGLAALSVIAQTMYIILLIFSGKFVFGGFNYLSPLVVCGVIVWGCYLVSMRGLDKSLMPKWLFLILLAISFGHSSAVMAIISIPFIYILLKSSINYRLYVCLLFFFFLFLVLYMFPEIIDVNASWRFSYWENAMERIFSDWNWLFGHGFGQLYADDNTHYILLNLYESSNDLDRENEGYLKAFHNSFITIFFHLGILCSVFMLPQARSVFLKSSCYENTSIVFYALSLFCLSVWVFFNVILELPHSAHYYWLILFLCFNSQNKVAHE